MKADRVLLYQWVDPASDEDHHIPWPRIHSKVGHDALRWINGQHHNHVQLVLEQNRGAETDTNRLYVEFYVDGLRSEFALLFSL